MSDVNTVGSDAWAALPGVTGAFVLMDHATGFRQPRLILSATDEYFLRETVRAAYPGDTLTTLADHNRKYLVRYAKT